MSETNVKAIILILLTLLAGYCIGGELGVGMASAFVVMVNVF